MPRLSSETSGLAAKCPDAEVLLPTPVATVHGLKALSGWPKELALGHAPVREKVPFPDMAYSAAARFSPAWLF
jgi:hypothetical protein